MNNNSLKLKDFEIIKLIIKKNKKLVIQIKRSNLILL